MAKVESEQTIDVNVLAAAIAAGVSGLVPKPPMTEGDPEYIKHLREEGFYDDFFGVTVLQNAYEAIARGESEQTRKRASQLKAGRYLNGRVSVSVENNGGIVRISYPISGDNMMKNMTHWASFKDLIDKIWAEQEVKVS
jgi:hypothetical protein